MKHNILIHRSKVLLQEIAYPQHIQLNNLFTRGAEWMLYCLNHIRNENTTLPKGVAFEYYGWGKYLLCSFVALIPLFLSYWLVPLSILLFYLIEVQLLFLFPLLIDGSKNSFKSSWRLTRQIGTFRAMIVVIPIAIYMLYGMCRRKDCLQHWYVGCLSILILYEEINTNEETSL